MNRDDDEVTVVMTEAALRASPVWEAFTEEERESYRSLRAGVEVGDTEPAPPPVEGEE